jgi:hypothetical protein
VSRLSEEDETVHPADEDDMYVAEPGAVNARSYKILELEL